MTSFLTYSALWVGAFGYFVDLFDIVLFGVVRVQSLKAIHVPDSELFATGSMILNFQMGGMLAGGVLWGILGDRRGRKSALFGSIFLYSVATFLNAFAETVSQYEALRFLAGFGLAGELGAAITLATEVLPQDARGLGAAFIATLGFGGGATGSYLAQFMNWQHAYMLGGTLGLVLLLARLNLAESDVYLRTKSISVATPPQTHWGSLQLLVLDRSRLFRLFLCLLVGVPVWYVAGILGYFAPELAQSFHITGEVSAGTVVMLGYLGAILGDILCGGLSQILKSRKKAVGLYVLLGGLLTVGHNFWMNGASAESFYFSRFVIGFANGYVAVLVAWVAELFGTNLRATTTTLVPNLIRAAVIPLTAGVKWLVPYFGLSTATAVIGAACYLAAFWALLQLKETFSLSIEFKET